jgi:hypothetical protein
MLDGPTYNLGQVELQPLDRLFVLPEAIDLPLDARFEPGIYLRGASVETRKRAPGQTLPLVLFWQTEVVTDSPVTAFVHLVDQQGNLVTQSDRWPGGLPSNIWAEKQVIIDEYELRLPPDLAAGAYQILVGLYDAESGQRLAAEDAAGRRLANDRVLLPVTIEVGS